MGILSEAEYGPMRAALEYALPDRCAIKRMTRTVDATTGGWTEAEETFASGIPCRVDTRELSAREREVGGALASVAAYFVVLSTVRSRWPSGSVDVRATDRLVVTGDASGEYEPTAPGGPTSDELVRSVGCTKVS